MLQISTIVEAFWQLRIDFLRVKLSQCLGKFDNFSTDLRTILSNFVATDVYALFNSPLEKSATRLYKFEGGSRAFLTHNDDDNNIGDDNTSHSDFIRICAAWSWYPDIAKDNCFLFESDEREPENCDRLFSYNIISYLIILCHIKSLSSSAR